MKVDTTKFKIVCVNIFLDQWKIYYNAVILMGLCTVLVLVVLKGSRNITTLAIIPLVCFAIAKTAQFKWKGGNYSK